MMKKHSNSRPLKLALTLCLIMAISLAGVVLDSTGVSAAVTGSGTSSDPYIFTSEYPFSLGDLYSEVQDKFTLSNSKKYRLVYGTYEGFNSSEDDRPEWRYGTNYTFDYQKYTSIIITGWWSVQSTHTFQVNEYFNATVNFPDSYADRSIYYNSPNGIISCSHRNSFNLYNSNSIISVPRVEGKGIDITVSNKSIVSSITKNGEFYDIVLDLSSFSEYNVTLDIEYVDFPVISVSADPLEGTIGSVKAVNMDVDDLEGSSVWAEPGHTVQLVAEPAENCSLFGWKLPDGTVEIVPKGQPLTKNIIAGSNDQNYKAIFHTNSDPYVYRNGSKYYHQSELRQAIIDAQSGTNKTIVLVANARLDYSIEIPDGVTLLLPYAKGAEDVKSSSDTFPHANYFAEGQTSKLSTATDTKDRYLQLIVDVPSGSKDTTITIANGGRLVLGGKISADQGEYSGHTFATYTYKGTTYTGGHSDIVLDNPNSKILVDNGGVLSSIGYITGTGTVEANKNGTIYKPLIINDFGGGSYTTACWLSLSEKISPFDRYSMINIQTDIVLNPGSKLIGYCDLVAESEHYQTKAPLIGPSDSIIETGADSDTVITIDYDAETGEGAKTNFSTGNIVQDTLVTIDGSVTFGYLELTLVGTNIETNSVVFPLPYNYKLHFTRGTVEVPHRYKIMPGAEIEVDPGVTMNLGNGSDTAGLYVYDGFHSLKTNGVNYPLPEELYNAGYSQRARVIMNGTLNVNKNAVYAGILESTVSGAKLNIASNAGSHSNKTLTEGNAANKGGLGWSSTSTITLNGQLYVAGDEDLIPLVNGKSYTSIVPDDNSPVKTDLLAFNQTNSDDSVTNTLYSAESIYGKWTTSSTLTIDANGGSFPEGTVTSITMGSGLKILEVLPALNTATRTGYTQIGWNYVKNDQTIAVSEKSLMPGSTDITVKAVWDPNTYNVQFITNTMEGVDFPSVSSVTGIYGETLGEKAPSDPQKLGYTFEGWYKTAEFKNADKVDFSKYTVPVPEEGAESVVLYAKWTLNRYKLTYKYGYIEDDPETTDKDESVIDLHSTEKIYGDSIEEPTLDDREGYIFAGWDKEVPATMPAKDLTFIAQWTPIEYTITYKDGNAQLSGLSPVSYTIETESFSLPSLDDKTGYTFAGWTGSNGNTAQKDVTIVKGSTGNKTYTANWTPIDYTITFEENGGSAVQDITKGYELAVQAPIAPTKTGYTFGGWYENKECTGDTYAFNTMPLNGKTLYAKWNVVTYQIEYTMDGGVLPEGAVTSYTIESDEITLPTPTREGYTFGGWKDSEGVAAEKIAAGSTGNKEFTATWDAIEYGITYDLADGSLAGTNPATYTVEDGITLINPTKEGYDFAGWTGTDLDGAVMNVTIENGSIGARSYTATWTPTEYEITYVLGDGALADGKTNPAIYTVESDEITLNNPTKPGYDFAGWTGTGLDVLTETVVIAAGSMGDRQYTANWTPIEYTIDFEENGGSPVTAIQQDYDTPVTAPDAPTKTGYTFGGWYENKECTGEEYCFTTMPLNGTTLYAKWNVNSYKVTFNAGDGTFTDGKLIEQQVAYGEKIPVPENNPTRTGHTFAGWDAEIPATMPAKDLSFTANYTVNKYKVYFKDEDGETDLFDPVEVTYNEVWSIPSADPTKEGYTFEKWDKEPSNMGAADLIVKAEWNIESYTIKMMADENEFYSIQGEFGSAITAPETNPTKEGYTFNGWVDAEDLAYDVPQTMPDLGNPNAVKTIYAKWIANKYTITFANTGDTKMDPVEQDYNSEVKVDDPTKEGYTFDKWVKVDADGKEGEEVTFPINMPLNGLSVKAVWTANQYKIEFAGKADDEDFAVKGAMEDQALIYDLAANLLPVGFTREGYYFTKWARTGTDETYNDKALVENLTSENNGTVSLIAQWAIESYQLVFDPNGGAFEDGATEAKTVNVTYNEASVDVPANPTQTGYTFGGWDPIVSEPVKDLGENGAVQSHVAQWEINRYTITFDTDGGSAVDSITQDYNTAVTAPDAPTKTGYTFAGWDKEIPATMPAEDMTIKAKWTINRYTITFDTDGGSAVDSITQNYGTEVVAPAAPTKTGYTFAGWDTEIPETMPAGDMTITAKWTINQYTITFENTGDTEIPVIKQNYGSAVTAPAAPTKTGYTFAGWDAEIPATMPAEDVTITAKWNINQYTITFDTDGGSAVDSITQNYATAVTAPSAPTKIGYTFAGWDAEIPATMPAEDLTIKAKWTINQYTITFDTAGGSTIAPIKQDYATAVTTPAAPTKEGYTFVRWDTEIPATMPAGDMTITAQWSADSYTVTFDVNNGNALAEEDASRSVTYDASYGELPVPTRIGYTFDKWTLDGVEVTADTVVKMVGDHSLVAVWTANTYTITLDYGYKNAETDDKNVTESINAVYDQPYENLPHDEVTRLGYRFDGWFTKDNVKVVTTDSVVAPVPETLYARWTESDYNIGYNLNGGTNHVDNPSAYSVTDLPITLQAPTKLGYDFIGWTYGDLQLPETMVTINAGTTGDLKYTAHWKANEYTITFDTDGGSAVEDIKADCDSDITKPADPTKEGYTFKGWMNDNVLITEFPATMPANGLELKAKWEINQYTITFANTGDTVMAPLTQDYNTVVNAPTDPVKEGYTFAGWDIEIPATMPAGNMTITAKWTINQYTITFANTGDTAMAPITQDYNTVVTAPADPEKEGYTFAGWDKVIPTTMPAGDIIITARWTVNQYDYAFVVDGTTVKSDRIDYGTEIIKPETPVKEGYTFVDWSPAVPTTMPAEDLSFTAQWQINSHDVTFIVDGKTLKAESLEYGATVVAPADPEKEGYTFAGWGTEIPATMPDEELTFIAQWTVNQYTITFDTDGGSAVSPITQDYNTAVIAPDAPTKEGYTFDGWDTEIPATMPAEDVTITANWTINQYTITFDTDGGSVVDSITQDYATAVTEPADPIKEGYTFAGWDKEVPAAMPAGDMTITAKWTINQYTITFANTGDTVMAPLTQDYNTVVNAPTDPVKEGYTFAGWDTEIPATMPAEDVTITAKWNINQYTITFANTGDTVIEPIAQNYGTEVTAPADPEREGYTFAGWDKEIPATMPAGDMTITAQWTVNSYTLTIHNDSELTTKQVAFGTSIVDAVEDPAAREGYTFDKWYLDEDFNTVLGSDVVMTTKGEDIFAKWDANKIKLILNPNSGTFAENVASEYIVYYDGEYNLPDAEDISREGYTFLGWTTKINGAEFVENGSVIKETAETKTLYARWQINSYNLIFENGYSEENNIIKTVPLNFGVDINANEVKPVDPTREGYTFAGWDVDIPEKMPAEDVTITARWNINQYTITFDTDGGSEIAPIKQDYNTAVTAPADPEKEGYTFVGWDVDIPEKMPADDMTIKANWTINQYTITFDADGGSAVDSITQNYNTAVTAPADPEREGYNFAGWDKEIPATMPAVNQMITATWTPVTYNIIYDLAGGSLTDDESNAASYTIESNSITLKNPVRAGYTFAGWTGTDLAEVTQNVTIANGSIGNRSYTATWEPVSYTITYDLADGSFANDVANPGSYNIEFAEFTLPIPTKTGYTFAGWTGEDLDEATETVTISQGSIGNREYTATWTVNQYSITFDTDGGNEIAPITQDYNSTVIAPVNPTKTGYTFAGWDKEFPATMPAEDMIIKAAWTINQYTITFDTDGGSAVAPIKQDYATAVTAPDSPTKTGYTFAGWDTEIPATMPAENLIIKAKWTINQYKISFNSDGGSSVPAIQQDYGTPVTAPAVPAKTGYTFEGWMDGNGNVVEIPATMPAGNITFKAKWQINQYTITFDSAGGTNVAPMEVDYNGAVVSPIAPTKIGYTFKGWNPALPATMPAEDIEVTAEWSINTYNLYLMDGENVLNTISAEYQSKVTAPADPEKDGYLFDGWYSDAELNQSYVFTDETVMPAEGFTLYSKWISYLDLLFAISVEDINNVADQTALKQARAYYMLLNKTQRDTYKTDLAYADHKNVLFERIRVVSIEEMRDEVMASKDETNASLNVEHKECENHPDWVGKQQIAAMNIYNDPDKLGEGYMDAMIHIPSYEAIGMLNIPFLSTMFPFDPQVKKVVTIGSRPSYELEGKSGLLESDQFNIMFNIAWEVLGPEMEYNEFYNSLYKQMDTIQIGALDGASVPVEIIGTSPEGVDFELNYTIHFFNKNHTVTWINGEDVKTSVVSYDTPFLGMVPEVTKIGHTFDKWNTKADGTGDDLPNVMGKTDVTYYALWKPNTYTVSLNAGTEGSVEPKEITVTYGEAIIGLPDAVPNSERHVFAGWSSCGKDYGNGTLVDFTEDATFTAKWEIDVFRISYDLDGGNVAQTNPATYKETSDTFTLHHPSKIGYTFIGWTGTGLTSPTLDVVVEKGSNGDREYKANWEINSYDLVFNANGGSFNMEGESEEITLEVLFGEKIEFAEIPQRTGYTFDGWDGNIPSVMPADDLTFRAKWKINQYAIVFDTDGGTEIAPIIQNYGNSIQVPADPVKEGYTFFGWMDEDGNAYEVPKNMPAENRSVKAVWKINQYSISFDSGVDMITQDYGTPIVKPADPVKAGYTFLGWLDGSNNYYEIPQNMPAEDMELTADWKANTYMVTLDPGKGVVDTDHVTITYDSVYGELPVPSREGYDFAGWVDESGSPILATTMVTILSDQRLIAVWNASGDTPYVVNHYLQNITGDGYTLEETEDTLHGATDSEVKATYKPYNGFHVNESLGNVSGEITADGKLVLNVYYDRDVYTITWIVRDGEVITESYRYGDMPNYIDTEWETDIHASYIFAGWNPAVSKATADVTYVAQYDRSYEATILGNNVTYRSLKDALSAAKANDVVRLDKDIILDESLTVPDGVTLLLSCVDDDPGYVYHKSETGNQYFNPNGDSGTKKTSQGVGPDAKLYRKLTVPDGITLTVEGTVMVNAVTGRPSAGDYDHDITGGYAQIDLSGDIVVENGGTFENFGYVKGDGLVTAKNGSSVGDLYIVRSWRGGSQGLKVYQKGIYPMNEYDMHNIEADVRVEYGASYYGLVKMYASDSYHYCRFPQVDLTNGLIRPTEEDSYVIHSYENGYENYSLYGGGHFGSGTLTAAGITLSSAEVFYPWDGDITFDLYDGEYHFIKNDKDAKYVNGFKFLTGGGLTVHTGSELVVDPDVKVVFYQEFDDVPTGATKYPDRDPAVLTVEEGATFRNAGTFAGHIYTESPDILIGLEPIWEEITRESGAYPGATEKDPAAVDLSHDLSIMRPGYDWKFGEDDSIVWIGADYTAVKTALEKVPADLESYSPETVKVLDDAITAVVYDLSKDNQSKVDQWAKDIEDAIAALKVAAVKISFDPCDGTLSETIILTKSYGEEYGTLPVPSWDGYEFIGWYTAVTGGTKINESSIVRSNIDHTLYARYTEIKEEPAKPADYSELDKVIASIPSELGGYTDASVRVLHNALDAVERGLNEDRQGDIDAWTVAIGNAITALQPKTFTVTYDACGGKMAIRSFDVVYGESFGELDQPVRTYYIFDGWYTAAEGGNLVTEDTVMTGITDLTIYAHWIQIDADYSSVEEALALITEDYELYYDESSIANIKAAVDAVEWGLGVESQKQINDWASDIRKAWNARKGKLVFVRYDANTGNVTSYGKEVRYGSTYGNLPTATHSNENYTFIGWFTEKNGGMQITPTTKVILTEDHILYARYEGMETQLADYSSVDAALGRVPADLSAYTDDSIQMLQAAINAVERDLTIDYQSTVNGWAEAINTAVDGLKLKAETIAPLDQVIGVETFVSAVYGDAPIHLNANAETTLTYEVLEGANIVNVDAFGNVTIIGAGMAKVKVTAVANEKYNAAEAIVAINVSKKSAKVTMQDVTVIEGETIEYLWTIDGFLDIDQTEIIITPKVDGNIISADVSGAKAGNYNVVVNTAVLTVLEPDYKMNCSGDESCPIYSFRDASTTAWYHDGVHYCLEKGVMNGFPEGLYKPDGEVTRAQLVVMLWRMEGSPIANYTLTFNDMDADWYKEAIRWAASEEIVKGHSEKEFAPDDPITREQLAAIFQRYASYKGYTVTERASLSSYVDAANVSSWAKDAVEWSVAVGLINGKSATELAPQDTATRAQAATMVYRFCEVIF